MTSSLGDELGQLRGHVETSQSGLDSRKSGTSDESHLHWPSLLQKNDRDSDSGGTFPRPQFHQHLWHQSRAAFAQIIFRCFQWQQLLAICAKIWCTAQKLLPQICTKFSAEILV